MASIFLIVGIKHLKTTTSLVLFENNCFMLMASPGCTTDDPVVYLLDMSSLVCIYPISDLQGFDFIMIGSPTRFARADGKALSVLKQLRKKGFAEIPVAIFDTYGPVPTDPKELEKNIK